MRTLARSHTREEEVKRSRFIARAAPVATPEEAVAFVERVSEPDATHNCWAYKVGEAYRFFDDGEPGGTAGRPILSAIERQELDHVAVVVTRYFGGIKLGAGGLVRAYGGAAASCLRETPVVEVEPTVEAAFRAAFEQIGGVHAALEQHGAEKLGEEYTPEGVVIRVRIPASARPAFAEALRELSRGEIELVPEP